jgi:hypothetical protein
MAVDTQKIKERLADLAHRGREAALNFLDDFRRQTKHFKQRVLVVGVYAGLVLLTLWVAPVGAVSNPIDAVVKATSLPWGMRNKTVIELYNDSGDDYENLIVFVEGSEVLGEGAAPRSGRWKYTTLKLKEKGRLQIEAKNLIDESGLHPAPDFAPSAIEVRCDDGVYRDVLALRTMR